MIYSAKEKREAVEREIAMRRRVYPRFIEAGKVEKWVAERNIAIFEAILEDYSKIEETERLI